MPKLSVEPPLAALHHIEAHMHVTWHHQRPIRFRSTASEPSDSRFPRAVAGEEYDRYARAVWTTGQRWMRRHWPRLFDSANSVEDARDALHDVAMIDLGRRLYPQEEQLLSELVHRTWTDAARAERSDIADINGEAPARMAMRTGAA